jgi:predicted ATPase/transcriptional regulator with GAF, ATPase, and Fis domain
LHVEGYEILREQSRGPWHILYSALEQATQRPVLLKVPAADPPSPGDLEALENEYAVLKDLAVAGVPEALGLVRSQRRRYLVFEDAAAVPISVAPAWRRPDVHAVLRLAAALADILAELHGRGIAHNNLNSSSIHVHPDTGRVHLTDFSMASRATDGPPRAGAMGSLRAALPYMSPEQTGRMNRATDYRTDYYSLGIVLYELLTGRVPFLSDDPLEVMHWHIARAPVSPADVDPRIPQPVSRIVMKLLSKTVEDRYQSAIGLQADLQAVADAMASGAPPGDFTPGLRDVWDRFVLPLKLYGRTAEVDAFRSVFAATCEGSSALMLIGGYPGIGKTALIYELYRPLVRRRGYFTAGKFDQVVRNTPFGALIQALSGLVQQLLTERDDRLAAWRERVSTAIGSGASVLAEVIPEIALLLGEQAAPPRLGPAETLNRFQLVFQSFLGALAQPEHPLVIFLDDLQWADAATLGVLQPLLTSADVRHLLLIGAYRDNEVDAAHPLMRTARALQAAAVEVSRLVVGPLALDNLTELLRDSFHPELHDVEDVARAVLDKTGGNPFFVIQFLKTLRQEGLLHFDHRAGQWRFRRDAVASAAITDNVIDLMTRGIQRLPAGAQRVLTLAACVGGRFDLATMAAVCGTSIDETAADVRQALDEGFILPVADAADTYIFLHDRVQQAAYALISEHEKSLVHLNVGRLLLGSWDRNQAPEQVFDIVGHLNLGAAVVEDRVERIDLARLNLEAGRRAKMSTAYDAAATYLDRGLTLLAADAWQTHEALTFALSSEAAECHYLAGRFDVAESHFQRLLERAESPRAKAQVHAARIVLYENQSHYQRAVSSGREGLALFGILLPDDAEAGQAALNAEIDAIQRQLGERSVSSLVDLPVMTDEDVRVVMRILTSLWSSAYITGNQVTARLISAIMVRLSLANGNAEDSAYGYVTHAITIGPMRGDYASAYEWGALALAVNERFDDPRLRAKIHQQFHAHVKLWRRPFESCLQHAREACRSGLEAGDLNYAGYGAVTETWPAFLIARDLDRFLGEYEPAAALLERLRLADFLTALRIVLSWAYALQGRTAAPLSLSNEYFDEEGFLAKFEQEPFFRTFFDTAKLHLSVLLDEPATALASARRARQGTLAGTIWPVLADFWGSLALTKTFATASAAEQRESWQQLIASERSLGVLADNCPENYRCFWLLLSGEMKRIAGEQEEAERLCRAAVAYAVQTGNLQMEALGNELCALACSPDRAPAFLLEARRCYEEWGALSKVLQLERKYGDCLTARGFGVRDALKERAVALQPLSLDMSTVLKAAHAIGAEIRRDDLLRKLTTIALENAGAQRSFFIRERDGRLVIEAEGSVDGDSLLRVAPLDDSAPLAAGVVRYVRKTGQSVVIADAAQDERFAQDPYIASANPRSIVCVPAVQQGKLEGILYLENNLAADAFTTERITVLDIIASQAAISLENARLYHEMKQEAARRRLADEALREMTAGTAAATGTDFFRSLVRHLASALGVRYAFVTECRDEWKGRARSLAFWRGDGFGENFEFDVAETPCQKVIAGHVCFYSDDLQRLFPNDLGLADLNAQSYLGAPMVDASDRVIGHVAILDDKPMPEDPWASSILRIFSARAAAELERLRAEDGLRAALTEVEALKNRLQAENVYLQEELRREHNFEEMVGGSPALLDVLRRVERVAPTDATVLIYGETGTGKELIARAIHSRSARRNRPLVKVNCGAISAGLVESELFGHVKGAFTGAIDKRVGRFELANGGTLFLDEVSELPLDTQVKLLRVLQEQEFEPVGSSRSIRVSVRIIAATNRDLEEAVRLGRFRSDLFFRLNVLPIHLPPLRERRTDVPQLVTFFLARFAKQFGKQIDGVTRETLDLLVNYPWPGNVRELQNVIERAVVLSPGPVLKLDRDLLPPATPAVSAEATTREPGESLTPPLTLVEIERRHILAVLKQTGGVIEGSRGAARILNLHPNTLRSRMKKLGVSRTVAPS